MCFKPKDFFLYDEKLFAAGCRSECFISSLEGNIIKTATNSQEQLNRRHPFSYASTLTFLLVMKLLQHPQIYLIQALTICYSIGKIYSQIMHSNNHLGNKLMLLDIKKSAIKSVKDLWKN